MTTEKLIAEVERLDKLATKGPWHPGRKDMQSYHGHDGNAFTNIYADDERAGIHLGHQLPLVIGEANGEHKERAEERANAELMALSRTALPQLAALCREQEKRIAELEASTSAAAAQIGEPPEGSHPDERLPRADTWHKERENWQAEVKSLRDEIALLRRKLEGNP